MKYQLPIGQQFSGNSKDWSCQNAWVRLVAVVLDKGMLSKVRPTEPLRRIFVQQTLQKVFEHVTHIVWVLHRIFHNEIDERVDVVGVEGRNASK